jgi:8-oxo-dGTP diphosphatase
VIHRPAYDDWALPKGKAEPGELLATTAVREVEEESAVQVRLGASLTPQRYPIGAAMKFVTWWVGHAQTWTKLTPNPEVDRVKWMRPDKALKWLTYANDRAVLTEALTYPDTTPLLIVRHAKAVAREKWAKKDHQARHLSKRGQAQLPYIGQILTAFGVTRLRSSPAERCLQTLAPFAKTISRKIKTDPALDDTASDQAVADHIIKLARTVGARGIPTAICSHLLTIPTMLEALDIPPRPMATGSCIILHLDKSGRVAASEWHDTLRAKAR